MGEDVTEAGQSFCLLASCFEKRRLKNKQTNKTHQNKHSQGKLPGNCAKRRKKNENGSSGERKK